MHLIVKRGSVCFTSPVMSCTCIPPGHRFTLQSLTSMVSPLQFTSCPPSAIAHFLILACAPLPQLLLHEVHSCQLVNLSTGGFLSAKH